MSITINGATNTLTAASGLTIAGNTAVTGTLSSTGTATIGAATHPIQINRLSDADTYGAISFNSDLTAATGAVIMGRGGAVADTGYIYHLVGSGKKHILRVGGATVCDVSSTGLAVTGTLSASKATAGDVATFTNGGASPLPLYVYSSSAIAGISVGAGLSDRAIYFQSGLIKFYNGSDIASVSTTGLAVTGTLSASSHILPTVDNTSNLGSAALGMKELFCDNGTINTSDARRKTAVSALSTAEINAAKQLAKEIGSFKFLAAIAEKGDAARLHIGMTVQRAIEIMEANGLDPFAYSFICHDDWDDMFVDHPAVAAIPAQEAVLDEDGNVVTPAVESVEGRAAWTEQTQVAGDKYSFRVHELLLFMAAGFEARLSALEAA